MPFLFASQTSEASAKSIGRSAYLRIMRARPGKSSGANAAICIKPRWWPWCSQSRKSPWADAEKSRKYMTSEITSQVVWHCKPAPLTRKNSTAREWWLSRRLNSAAKGPLSASTFGMQPFTHRAFDLRRLAISVSMTAKVRCAERKQTAVGRSLMRGGQAIERLLNQRRFGKARLRVQALDQFRLGFGQADGEELCAHDCALYYAHCVL